MGYTEDLQSASSDEVAHLVENLYLADQDYRRPFEAVWAENLAFYAGDHYTQIVATDGSVRRMPSLTNTLGYIPRPRTNYILKNVRGLVANFLKSEPRTMVRPRGTSDDHIVAARLAEKVDESLDELQHWDEKIVELANWMVITGCAFRKDYVDSTEAARGIVPRAPFVMGPDGEPIDGTTGEPLKVEPQSASAPYVAECEVLSPFQIAADPLATRMDNARWILEMSLHPVEWLQEMYAPKDSDGKRRKGYTGEADDLKGGLGHVSPGLLYWIQLKGGTQSSLTRIAKLAVAKEYYSAPTPKNPYGLCAVVADDKLLFKGPSPYMPKFWHPYTMFPFLLMPGRFWPLSVVEMLVHSQRRLNSIDAMRMYNRNMMAAPRWWLPKGSGVQRDHITGVPGQVSEYNAAAGAPVAMDGKGLPPDVIDERAQTVKDMEEIAGTVMIAGDRERGVPSYSGLAFLQESTSDIHLPTYRLFEMGLERSARKRLEIVSMYYTHDHPELTVMLRDKMGQHSNLELKTFTSADLMDSCDLRVEAGSSIARSRVLYQQTVLQLLANQMLAPAMQDPEQYEKLLDIFGLQDFSGSSGEDVRKAQLENAIFQSFRQWKMQPSIGPEGPIPPDVQQVPGPPDPMTGQPTMTLITPVTSLFLPEENHQIHLLAHIRLLKNPKSIEQGPLFMQAVRSHVQQHQQVLQQQAMQQAMMPQQGAPAKPPAPTNEVQGIGPEAVAA